MHTLTSDIDSESLCSLILLHSGIYLDVDDISRQYRSKSYNIHFYYNGHLIGYLGMELSSLVATLQWKCLDQFNNITKV